MGFRTDMRKWEHRECGRRREDYGAAGFSRCWCALRTARACVGDAVLGLWCRMRAKLVCERGQGTTEYAILVGVLVVIAIIAITVFRPKLEELWNAIAEGINSL